MEFTVTPLRISLLDARKKAGLTQTELADKANVRQATISEIERGATSRIDLDVLDRLSAALGVEPGELLEREGKRRRPK
jgi:transcriptional regulator with XRE-family HTH domain